MKDGNNGQNWKAGITQITENGSKSDLLAELVRDSATLGLIGAAWFLYLRLVLTESGSIVGNYEEIGQVMGTGGKTVRNWVKALESAGIVKSQAKGHQISLQLLGKHIAIAQAPNVVVQKTVAQDIPMSDRMKTAMALVEAAERAGSKIQCQLVI